MRPIRLLTITATLAASALAIVGCKDSKSYAELLTDETHAVNYYLADQRVVGEIPADSIFITGKDAPYYRIDEDGQLYMQVIEPGNRDDKAEFDELIYFRFTRYDLNVWMKTGGWYGSGNAEDLTNGAMSFRFGNTALSSTTQYGVGIQKPLEFLGIDCEVNLIVKSQYGPTNEISNVTPFLYHLRYYRSPL